MKSELIVDVQPQEIAIALTEDDRLQEVNREKRNTDNFAVGNIYYGRVKKVMPALNAVFVDVGYEKEAFLHYLDLGADFRTMQRYVSKAVSDRRHVPAMNKIQHEPEVGKEGQIADLLKVGDTLLVQVTKEPINTKGPRLTAEISIAGRNMVLMPCAEKVMVSSKIKKESERSRLKQLLQSIKPQGFGVIVRTVAEDKRVAELDSELSLLINRWEETVKQLQRSEPVALVSEEFGRTIGIIRDVLSPSFTTIQINDKTIYDEVRQYIQLIAPDSIDIVKLYKGDQPIFDKFDITRQMKTGLGRTVGFKNGGYLIIDKTEALFSIDVNSGSKKLFDDQEQNAFHFNMLAADEIAHQLRLRDIGGIIIVDFIDMDDKDHQQELFEHMKQLMSRDRAKHNVLPLSKFGLMQITRQRVRPAVEMEVTETCPTCMGKGKIQPSILFTERIEEQLEHMYEHFGRGLRLHLHPYVFAYLSKGLLSKRMRLQWKYGVRIVENQSLGMLEMRFLNNEGKTVEPHDAPTVQQETKKQQPKSEPQKQQTPAPAPQEQPKAEPVKQQPKPTATKTLTKSETPKQKNEATAPVELPKDQPKEEQPKKEPKKKQSKAIANKKQPEIQPQEVQNATETQKKTAKKTRKKTNSEEKQPVTTATEQ